MIFRFPSLSLEELASGEREREEADARKAGFFAN
jgi:hypothetical protein